MKRQVLTHVLRGYWHIVEKYVGGCEEYSEYLFSHDVQPEKNEILLMNHLSLFMFPELPNYAFRILYLLIVFS